MTANIQPFNFEGNEVRTIVKSDKPWFVAKDVCDILELINPREALKGLDQDERGSELLTTLGGNQEINIISESGLYSLVFKSRKPQAKRFTKWVTSEVLPTIRRTGSYVMPTVMTPEVVLEPDKLNEIGYAARAAALVAKSMGIFAKDKKQKLVSDLVQEATGYNLLARLEAAGVATLPAENLTIEDNWLDDFTDRCIEQLEGTPSAPVKTTVKDLYDAFVFWWKNIAGREEIPPHKKQVTKSLRTRGYNLQKKGGNLYIYNYIIKDDLLVEMTEVG